MTPNKHLFSLFVGASTLVLAGCDGAAINRSEVTPGYTGMLYVQTQAQNGTNAVLVRDAPVPPDAVLAALRERYEGNQYRFALGPTAADWNGYTIVLGFGGPPIGTQNQCENLNIPLQPPSAGRTSLVGDYCYGNRLVSEVTGWTGAVSGPDDPKLRNLVGDVVAELFSYRVRPGKHGSGGGSAPR